MIFPGLGIGRRVFCGVCKKAGQLLALSLGIWRSANQFGPAHFDTHTRVVNILCRSVGYVFNAADVGPRNIKSGKRRPLELTKGVSTSAHGYIVERSTSDQL